jgi:endonuclease III
VASVPSSFRPEWQASSPSAYRRVHGRVLRLAERLERAYGRPDHGNLEDPLDEAIYIVLTYQTGIDREQAVWQALRAAYPSWDEVLRTREAELAQVLKPSGFHRTRAPTIKRLLRAVEARFKRLSLDDLRGLSREAAEAELKALPGLATKGARCVLLYSLGHQTFPFDSNTFRFFSRYGVLLPTARYGRQSLHDESEQLVPARVRYGMHVALVAHGRNVCISQHPRCASCPLWRWCMTGRRIRRRMKAKGNE